MARRAGVGATMRAAGLAAALALAAAGCDGGGDATCSGAGIRPHLSPVNLGDLWAAEAGAPGDPASPESVPYEWVLLLQSTCEATLRIDTACVVGDAHDGVAGDGAFTLEGPVPAEVPAGSEAAVRLTYDHPDPNTVDADDDGEPDPDRVAVVIGSNATDFPTLVVPVCARIVPRGQEREVLPCEVPAELTAGRTAAELCGGR